MIKKLNNKISPGDFVWFLDMDNDKYGYGIIKYINNTNIIFSLYKICNDKIKLDNMEFKNFLPHIKKMNILESLNTIKNIFNYF